MVDYALRAPYPGKWPPLLSGTATKQQRYLQESVSDIAIRNHGDNNHQQRTGSDCSTLNVPSISLSNVPGVSE